MDLWTAMELLRQIRNGNMNAEEAPAELWTWLADHVCLIPTSMGFQVQIED